MSLVSLYAHLYYIWEYLFIIYLEDIRTYIHTYMHIYPFSVNEMSTSGTACSEFADTHITQTW